MTTTNPLGEPITLPPLPEHPGFNDAWSQLEAAAIRNAQRAAVLADRERQAVAAPVAWCELTPNGQIAYFDGKPMVMPGPVGNDCHPHALVVRGATQSYSLDAKRRAFEAWEARDSFPESDLLDRCSEGAPRAGEYRNQRVQGDWEVWQAALAAPAPVAVAVKPVAWMVFAGFGNRPILEAFSSQERAEDFAETIKTNTYVRPVYATPAPAAAPLGVPAEAVDYSDLELPLEQLVDLCNNMGDFVSNSSEVIAAEAALEMLYKARRALIEKEKS